MSKSTTPSGADVAPTECRNCGSTSLTWEVSSRNNSGVVEGRLRTGDVESICFLGCDDCSETVKVVPTAAFVAALIARNAELGAENASLRNDLENAWAEADALRP